MGEHLSIDTGDSCDNHTQVFVFCDLYKIFSPVLSSTSLIIGFCSCLCGVAGTSLKNGSWLQEECIRYFMPAIAGIFVPSKCTERYNKWTAKILSVCQTLTSCMGITVYYLGICRSCKNMSSPICMELHSGTKCVTFLFLPWANDLIL